MQTKQPDKPCNGECGSIPVERNRYFTGKYMTARDFESEQQYFRGRHALHNRLLHGWGVVCGLRVLPHPNKECAANWVVVRAGIAIDCCGHELALTRDATFELTFPPAVPASAPSASTPATQASPEPAQSGPPSTEGKLLLLLRYQEEQIESVPVLYNEGVCDPKRQEANRVREVATLETKRLDEVDGTCWMTVQGDPSKPCRDDCDDELPGPAGICLEPECPCGCAVPLALLTFDPEHPENGFKIDMEGRRELPVPHDFHTHIVGINWPHGGDVTLSHLRNKMRGRLEVRFDRKLMPSDGHKTGINAMTFVVQYGGVQRDIKYLPFGRDYPPRVEEDCLAVFHINADFTDPEEENNVADNWIYITLKCDFILDCHGEPVDGAHLKGRLPSGDGRPGRDFESWFRVVDDKKEEERKRQERERQNREERERAQARTGEANRGRRP